MGRSRIVWCNEDVIRTSNIEPSKEEIESFLGGKFAEVNSRGRVVGSRPGRGILRKSFPNWLGKIDSDRARKICGEFEQGTIFFCYAGWSGISNDSLSVRNMLPAFGMSTASRYVGKKVVFLQGVEPVVPVAFSGI